MAHPNTGLTQSDAVIKGSCKIEISTDNGSNWTNVGLARSVVFNEQSETTDIQADNGPDLESYVSDHVVDITFNGLEFYLPTLFKIRGGIDLSTTVSSAAVTATDSYATGALSHSVPYYFATQGSSDTLPAISKVVQTDTGGSKTTLTSTSDYTTFTDANNQSGVLFPAAAMGGGFNDTEATAIIYAYGSIASRKLKSGGLTDISPRWWRLTNAQVVSGTTKYRYYTLYSGSFQNGLNLAFKSGNEADPVLETPITIRCKVDSTRTAGDQLYVIEDQVGVS